jgi:4-hydroxy-3-polyprenylbenzoate decarboxylase
VSRTFDDLRGFIQFLSERDDLVHVRQEVDPVLEVNAILDRLARSKGPAVLFERVKGSEIPVFGNAFGNFRLEAADA